MVTLGARASAGMLLTSKVEMKICLNIVLARAVIRDESPPKRQLWQRSIFSGDCKTYTKDTPQFACEGKVWSVSCEFTTCVLHIDGLVQDCSNSSALAMETNLWSYCSLALSHRYHSYVVCILVLKIRTICYAPDLWKLARSCKQLCLLCLPDLWNLPRTALLSGFQSWWELWNPMRKTVLSKCSCIWNKRPVNIWNDHKAEK